MSSGQEPSPVFTRMGFSPAHIVATNPFLSSDMPADQQTRWVPGITVEIGRQTDGSCDWHHLYGLPAYGVGVSVASAGNGVDISQPLDAYTFFSWPFARPSERVQVTTDFGMGLSWNWKAFNQQTRALRSVLGSDVNVRIDWGFYLRYVATPQTSVYAGVDFTHRSNGGVRQPDQGLNVIGPSVSLRHNLAPAARAISLKKPPPFRPSWELVVGGGAGVKNVMEPGNPTERHNFGAFDGSAGVQRHFYRYGKIAAGADVIYDGATGARFNAGSGANAQSRAAFGDRLAVGLYGGYEHVIGRFSALVQLGSIVADGFQDANASRLYQKYGWRYQVNDNVYGVFAVRAIEDRKADFLEFGAGYRKRWR